MFRALFLSILTASLLLSACGTAATPANALSIQPSECRLSVNETLPFSLSGTIAQNSVIKWEASAGTIASSAPGLNAFYTAPSMPTIAIISVTISSGTPTAETPIQRECIVTDPSSSPVMSSNPVLGTQPTIIISEVMANPCGGIEFKKWNEYVELYNFGSQPVDVSGWWLADNGGAGSPDQLTAWSTRNPFAVLPATLITDSTVIPPHGFALVLSPSYIDGEFPHAMPYAIPAGTIILTATESKSLGDDFASIVGDGQGRDVLVLYTGGPTVIQEIISTYGTPKPAQYVTEVTDNDLDNLPLDLHECSSIERIIPTGADSFDNWQEIKNGSPGEAPY